MTHLSRLSLLVWKIALIGLVTAIPDKYEVEDTDTNTKVDLLDLLNVYRQSNTFKNWTGRWMPSHPDEYKPPPKVFHVANTVSHHDDRIPMGVKNVQCDDGKTNLTVDWDYSATSYACFGKKTVPNLKIPPESYCEIIPRHYVAMHRCMNETIDYDEDIPLYGTHRPIWPVYGEYKYLPKQRWLHNLEHGGVVMLYHPCANNLEVQLLKDLVKNCLRRHIITPYNLLDEDMPLALVTWGCRLTMSHVNKEVVTKFILDHALSAPENSIYRDGDFDDQLIEKAKIVSDEEDSVLCAKLM